MAISNDNFISESIIWIRNRLLSVVVDPIKDTRIRNKEKFVLTSYPQRPVGYPIITVQQIGANSRNLGMQSEEQLFEIRYEIRIWARNISEKDKLSEEVLNALKNYQTDTAGSNAQGIYGFRLNSMVNVDEPGEGNPKSKILEITYIYINNN